MTGRSVPRPIEDVSEWSIADLVAASDYMQRELTVAEWYDRSRHVIATELFHRIERVQGA